MPDGINNVLTKNGYEVLGSNMPIIKFYVKKDDENRSVYMIACIDAVISDNIDSEQLNNVVGQVERKYLLTGTKNLNFIYLLYSNDTEKDKRYTEGNFNFWLIDIKTKRLVIYENQPADFDGLREPLESELIKTNNLYDYEEFENQSYKPKKRIINSELRYKISPYIFTLLLIIINVSIYFVLESIGGPGSSEDALFLLKHGALFHRKVFEEHEYYRLFTCMFLHCGIAHLFNNMFALWFIGREVEKYYGSLSYILFYFISGLGGSFFSALYNHYIDSVVVVAGASGAIYGIMGALVVKIVENKKGKGNNIFKIAFVFMFLLMAGRKEGNVDNIAHLGGFVVGMICGILHHLYAIRKYTPKEY